MDLASQLTTKLISVLRELLAEAAWCESTFAFILIIIYSARTRVRCFLARRGWVVRCLTLRLTLIRRASGRLAWRGCVVGDLPLLLGLVGCI